MRAIPLFLVIISIALIGGQMTALPSLAQSCGWYGTGPFCSGSCPGGMTQYQRWDGGCTTGSRAYCCRFQESKAERLTPAYCTEFGTGPICDGSCPSGWTERGRPTDGCVKGSKAKCCDFRDYCLSNGKRVLCATQTPFSPNPVTVMKWPFRSKFKKVEVKFFSKTRNAVWPGGNEVFTINDTDQHHMDLTCNAGEEICYGAWPPGDTSTFWGVGRDGKQGCTDCCRKCINGKAEKTVLGK